jgi:hypothetical protein
LVAIGEKILAAETPDDFVAHVAGDALGALIPENDLALPAEQIDAGGQAIQNILERFRIEHSRHAETPLCLSAGMGREVRGERQEGSVSGHGGGLGHRDLWCGSAAR